MKINFSWLLLMMLLAFLVGLLLVGCGPSEPERHEAYLKQCVGPFSWDQCEVLYRGVKASDEARQAAETAQAMGGAAFAIGVANMGGKR